MSKMTPEDCWVLWPSDKRIHCRYCRGMQDETPQHREECPTAAWEADIEERKKYALEAVRLMHVEAKLNAHIEALEKQRAELVWLLTHEPPNDLGPMTQGLRRKWCDRRDAALAAEEE